MPENSTPVSLSTIEEWRPVVGYEGIYDVSNLGRVRSLKTYNRRIPGKILKPFNRSNGYLAVDLYVAPRHNFRTIHILVAAAFIGPRPEGLVINHKDANKQNNCVENLEYITHLDNARHAARLGLYKCGDSNPARTHPERVLRGTSHANAKVNDEIVRQIRRLAMTGLKAHTIIRNLSLPLSPKTVNSIIKRETWRHVQ